MSHKSMTRYWAEYALLRGLCGFVNALPYGVACALARGAAHVAFRLSRAKRERTRERIRGCFPEKTPAEVDAIALGSLENLFLNAVEMIRAPRLSRAWMAEHVIDMEKYAKLLKAIVDEGKGVVIMVPHAGNWDLAAWAMARFGVPLFAIVARQRNPLVNGWMNRQRASGMEVVERGAASVVRDILKRLRVGKAFAILPDLRAPRRDTEVAFLNGRANVSHGAAMFAVAAGSPIVVAMMRRVGGRHQFNHFATLRPDPNAPDRREEARRLIREAMRYVDEGVRKTPEQWFWYNKRWILQPVAETGSALRA